MSKTEDMKAALIAFIVCILAVLTPAPVPAQAQSAQPAPDRAQPDTSPAQPSVSPAGPGVTPPHQVNFAISDNVIPLRSSLTPYHAPGGPEDDGSAWYMLALTNNQVRPVSRVILAGQPPSMALSLLPHS
ncbi:MAG TPA: hypothetical protein VG501_04125, partial [Rhizomicrobium sp.]|nr:hypothetical protein [Rhizomicrobium sp.]